MEARFHLLLDAFENVHLIGPVLPAPSSGSPFPSASVWEKAQVLAWSAWANLSAEARVRLRIGAARSYLDLLRQADRVVLRGCNIVQRDNDLRALASVRRVTFPMRVAQRMQVPTVLLNVSVGPLEHPIARRMVRQMIEGAEYVSARETMTVEYLGFARCNPVASADTVFALPYRIPNNLRDPMLLGLNILSRGEYLAAVWHSLQGYDLILKKLAAELNWLMRRMPRLNILGIPHEMDRVDMLSDLIQLRKLVGMLDYPERARILETLTRPEDVVSAYARCAAAIGMRFHGYVLAGLASTPMIGVDLNSRKVSGMAEALGVNDLMVKLERHGHLGEQVSTALASASDLQASVAERASRLRQLVLDSFFAFAQSSGMVS